jgi:signal transduction histidine kinase
LPGEVEAAVCLVMVEALQNIAKHAPHASVEIELSATDSELRFAVADDGPGFVIESQQRGFGLQSMADRMAAAGGQVAIDSTQGKGTRVSGRIPLTGAVDRPEPATRRLPPVWPSSAGVLAPRG